MPVTINGSNTPTAGGVVYGDGTEYASTSAGTSGQSLLSAGSSAPTWGTPASATTATNLAGGSAGTVPYQSAAGTTQMLAAGTSGQVLTSSGAGAPSWTTPSAGAMTLLATLTPTAASTIDALTTFTSSYDNYLILLQGISVASSGETLNARFAVAGSVDSTGLYQMRASPSNNFMTQTSMNLLLGSGTLDAGAGGFQGSMLIQNTNATDSSYKVVSSSYFYNTLADPTVLTAANYGVGGYRGTSALSGIRFFLSGGSNFAAQGKIRIYGISNS